MEISVTNQTENNSINNSFNEERKLKFREKVACVIGGASGTFNLQMISIYLLFFYTDIMKISAAYVAGLFLVARIIDAVVTPVFGIWVDRITTPWGKYRPWFLILGVPTAILGWLTFTDFNLSPGSKIVYITVTYFIFSVFFSVSSAPGYAITPAMTKRVDERVSIGQLGFLLPVLAAMVVSIGALPMYKALGGGNDAKGFSLLMGIFGVISILISIFQVSTLKERYIVQPSKEEKRPSLKEMFKAVFSNKATILVYVYVFALNLANGIKSGITLHYFKYYFHNEGLMVTMGIIGIVPMFVGAMLSGKITKWIGIRANVLLGAIVSTVTTAIIVFVPATAMGLNIFFASAIIGALFMGFATPAQGTMLPAVMDYTEWKSGLNVNAFMGSIQGVVGTGATAIAGVLTAGGLAFIGYVPGVEQSDTTIFGLKLLMGLFPAIAIAFTAVVFWFDLTEEKQVEIAKELEERRKNKEPIIIAN